MQISLNVKNPVSYLRASLQLQKKESRSIQFNFPSIVKCPVCGYGKCAKWKGYYWRKCIFPEIKFVGKLAIKTGHCRRRKTSFSFMPDFIIPYRQISICSLRGIWRSCRHKDSIIKGIIQYFQDHSVEIPIATVHANLKVILGLVRVNVLPKVLPLRRLNDFRISHLLLWAPGCLFKLESMWLSNHLHRMFHPP